MVETTYTFNGKNISYEILENGYMIYLDSKLWISQTEPYIPYPNLSYEEGCLKQIEEICTSESSTKSSEDKISELKEKINSMNQTTSMILLQIAQSQVSNQ